MGGGEVIKRGWLIKSPPLEGGGIKAWRRRFFMLRSSKVLEYYKSADGEVLKGVINLEDCKTVHSDLSHKKYKHVFDVETRDRTYYLVAHTQEEMKEWVKVLCTVCGLIVQDVPEFLESTPPVPQATVAGGSGAAAAGPTISSPIYSTPPLRGGGAYATPPNRGEGVYGSRSSAIPESGARPESGISGGEGGISFNERFRPSGEASGLESMYSLAHSVDAEVQRQLSGEQEIPAGTPLSEALASKGMSTINRSSSVSSASGGDATASFNPDSPSFLSPRHEQASVSQNLYSPVPKKPSSTNSSTSSGGLTRPVPKPRSATLLPTTPRTAEQLGSPAQQQLTSSVTVSGSRTLGHHTQRQEDLTADGYLKPQPKVASNYDRLPPGPPRPATAQNPQGSPKQHRSALLNPANPVSPASKGAPPPSSHINNPTYINVTAAAEEAPPMIDRRCKPAMPSPPRVDRNLKPRGAGSGSEDTPPISRSSSSSSSDSPPQFPTRTTSLANPEAPEFPVRTTSLEGSMAAMGGQVDDGAMDLPKPSTRTTQYTQVAFSSTTGNPILGGGGGGDGNPPGTSPNEPRRIPVPAPRRRVNYSDVDLVASGKLSEKLSEAAVTAAGAAARSGQQEITVSLTEAEEQELRDKPYINVDRKGKVDEATDPGYYMHMRNLTYQEALEIYNMPIESIDNEDDEEEEGLSNGIS